MVGAQTNFSKVKIIKKNLENAESQKCHNPNNFKVSYFMK